MEKLALNRLGKHLLKKKRYFREDYTDALLERGGLSGKIIKEHIRRKIPNIDPSGTGLHSRISGRIPFAKRGKIKNHLSITESTPGSFQAVIPAKGESGIRGRPIGNLSLQYSGKNRGYKAQNISTDSSYRRKGLQNMLHDRASKSYNINTPSSSYTFQGRMTTQRQIDRGTINFSDEVKRKYGFR